MGVKYHEIGEALEGLLREGEQLVVSRVDDEIHVRELDEDGDSIPSPLRDSDPDLYGFLLVANDRIYNSTGCVFPLVVLGGVIVACGAIGTFRPEFAYWWVFGLVAILGAVIWALGNEWREQVAYGSIRGELFEMLATRNMTRERLLTLLSNDSQISSVASRLKGDSAADHP